MSQALTLTMKTIFPNLTSFDEYLKNDLKLTGDFEIFIAPEIYNFYVNSNVAYDTDEAFKRHFGITLKDIFKRYEYEHSLIEKMYNVGDSELYISNKIVNIMANNDNSQVTTPLDTVLDFVSSQNISQQSINKLTAYYDAISKLSNDVIEIFIDTLRKHFVTILEPYSYYYKQ